MNKLFENPFTEVCKITALGVVCMLLLAVVSCESSNYPYEYDEPEIEIPSDDLPPPGTFAPRFSIFSNNIAGVDRFFMIDQISLERVEPINLPERFQQTIRVEASVVRVGEETNEFGYSFVEIKEIEETDIIDEILSVGADNLLTRTNMGPSGHVLTLPIMPWDVMIPTNLPKEFRVEGLLLQTGYRLTGERVGYRPIIEVVEADVFIVPPPQPRRN